MDICETPRPQQDTGGDPAPSPPIGTLTTNSSFASVAFQIKNTHYIRVYFQDVEGHLGMSECRDGVWKKGERIETNIPAKPNTPLAAIAYTNRLQHIRLFYVDMNNMLQEHCWDESPASNRPRWFTATGKLGVLKYKVDYRSKIAACATINYDPYSYHYRIYYQAPYQHRIVGLGWNPSGYGPDGSRGTWSDSGIYISTLPVLFGSGLAVIHNRDTGCSDPRVFYQHALDRTVRDSATGTQYASIGEAVSGTAIAAVTWTSASVPQVRLYYEHTDGMVYENGFGMNHVQEWSGPRKLTKSLMGTSLSACHWHSYKTTHIRVYFGEQEGKVLEYCGIGGWAQGAVVHG